jgi:hypothetical protein
MGSTDTKSDLQNGPSRHDPDGRALARADRNEALNEDRIASAFHEAYERLAPGFGYKTRDASAVPWEDVPNDNKRLMRAVVTDLLNQGVIRS